MQFPLAIPPGKSAGCHVFLPALSISQMYDIDLLPTDDFTAQPVGRVSADIHWPVNLLTKDAFLDPYTYRACYTSPPPWSTTTKTTALFVGIVITLALGAVLLVHRAGLRFCIWLGWIGCSLVMGFAWILFFSGGELRQVTLPEGYLVQTRRTGGYYLRGIGPQHVPLCAHRDEIQNETLIVHPDRCLYLTLRPDETRIFLERRERE